MGRRHVGVSVLLIVGLFSGVIALLASSSLMPASSQAPTNQVASITESRESCARDTLKHARAPMVDDSIAAPDGEPSLGDASGLPKVEIANRVGYELYTSRLSKAGRQRDARVLFDDPVLSMLINPNGVVLSDDDESRILAMYADHLERLAALSDEMLATRATVINRMFASGFGEGLVPATTPPIGLTPEQAAHVTKSVVLPPHTIDEEVYGRTVDGEMKAVRIRRGHVPEYDSVKSMLFAASEDVLTDMRNTVLNYHGKTAEK